jgi:hypothetical protein
MDEDELRDILGQMVVVGVGEVRDKDGHLLDSEGNIVEEGD